MRLAIIALASAALLAGCSSYDDGDRYADAQPWVVTHNGEEIDYEGSDEVLFAYDSANLSQRAYNSVASIADEVRHHPHWIVEVNGYTDTVGSQDYNLPLSQERAQSVADALVHNGIPPDAIGVHGFGKTHLAMPTADYVRERRNRRVVIRLYPPEHR
jgi:outer membrane protein OmpA-like peptidoglycan-associated protein